MFYSIYISLDYSNIKCFRVKYGRLMVVILDFLVLEWSKERLNCRDIIGIG